jgi:drug/metabolite transporter (DMT)-like permease
MGGMSKEGLGTILALITAIISGFAIPINKIFVVGIEPTVFTAVRALIIGLVFVLIMGFQSGFDCRKVKALKRGIAWKYLVGIGVLGGGLAFLMFFTGLPMTTAGRAAFLHKTLPVWAGIFAAYFLKERIPKKHWYALVIMLIGTFLIYIARIPLSAMWSNPGVGDALILGATILWAAENTMARKVMREGESNLVVSFSRMFIGALLLFGIIGVTGKVGVLMALTGTQVANLFISTAILFGYVFFWYWSLKHINVSKATAILLLAPVVSLAVGIWWFNEPFPFLQMIGSVLILIGAWFVIRIRGSGKATQRLAIGA